MACVCCICQLSGKRRWASDCPFHLLWQKTKTLIESSCIFPVCFCLLSVYFLFPPPLLILCMSLIRVCLVLLLSASAFIACEEVGFHLWKAFAFLNELGQGGTSETCLLADFRPIWPNSSLCFLWFNLHATEAILGAPDLMIRQGLLISMIYPLFFPRKFLLL